ncbi:MAG TPA: hypothetical protein ENI23_05930 [bacterium]|nr:hypothetical protein [bacterium]
MTEQLQTFFDQLSVVRSSKSNCRLIRDIVPIEEWIVSPYYLGQEAEALYPFWRDVSIEFERGGYNELILTGSIGGGKSYEAVIIIFRQLYILSCYVNFPVKFNLSPSSQIILMYMSLSMKVANASGYGKLRRMIDGSPYFQEFFPRKLDIDSELRFPNNISAFAGSDMGHFTGQDLFAIVLDEQNFLRAAGGDVGKMEKATNLYRESTNRRKSRFGNEGIAVIVSSSDTETAFTEDRIKKSQDDPNVLVKRVTAYKINPQRYSDKFFYVFRGTDTHDPFVLNEENRQKLDNFYTGMDYISSPNDFYVPPEALKQFFETPPVDFYKSFEIDVIGSLKEVCGVAVKKYGKLFGSMEKYNKCVNPERAHPFTMEEITLSTDDDKKLSDFFLPELLVPEKNARYGIHIDQSITTDATGIGMAHSVIKNSKLVKVKQDFLLRIIPPVKPAEIDIDKVTDFIIWLRDVMKFQIKLVTYDQYASRQSLQRLRKKLFNAELLSVDRNDEPGVLLSKLIKNEQYDVYEYLPFKEELFDVDRDVGKKKIDHPVGGSKDVFDGAQGSVWNAINLYDGLADELDVETIKLMSNSMFEEMSEDSDWFLKSMGVTEGARKKAIMDPEMAKILDRMTKIQQ